MLIQSFLKYVDEQKLFNLNQKVLLTVSGGIDSMVMADLFMKSGVSAGFAHCNFGLRGSESDRDEAFVRAAADKYNCPIYIKKMDVDSYVAQHGESVQVAAREMRYSWFEELMQTTDYELYATAHHFDDQVETFFINLLRGTGIKGLKGIPAKNGHCIRPLLFAERHEIEAYAKSEVIAYREDSSNLKDDYLRNRIRHFVVPALEKASPGFKAGMRNSFSTLSSTNDFLTHEINKRRSEMISTKNGLTIMDAGKLKNENNPGFVLYQLLNPFGFNFATVNQILESLEKIPGKQFFSVSHEVVTDRDSLIISPIEEPDNEVYHIYRDTRSLSTPVQLQLNTFPFENQKIPVDPAIAWLDYEKLIFPLEIRRYRQGDAFVPLGMKGRKKVSDFFIDEKIPIPEKRNIWIILSAGKIAWIAGHRIDNRFRITSETETVLGIKLI